MADEVVAVQHGTQIIQVSADAVDDYLAAHPDAYRVETEAAPKRKGKADTEEAK